ncbi:subclass B3 metallo-beta-lactamase [Duganella dendranthematis]|uniref:Subclass B3 metallo-beta-lactamase n=1 Tax=Duganella dendranthematis TaxID=2728021 RepID=A0ABX6MHW4_9BURK|nr:subclass B3 metallo-beta-lactamase [Duganella dendranthematis]QJD93908.1 subclass B3 metallo-beta-lactamase [Duganella dendranthematis]
MKKQIIGCITLMAACLITAKAADWYAPQEPFPLYGNTYYVGTGGISAVLITSPAGHILVDVGGPEATEPVVAHIRKLGFRVEDIRYILNSHAHQDHAGAIADVQKLSGATVLASPASVKVLESGQPDPADAQFPNLTPMSPVAHTRAVRDGEIVHLGPLAVTAHFTPGHTQGGVSWTWQAEEGGRTVNVVFADSLYALAAEGRYFSRNPLYPHAQADVERSIATVAALPCDVLISAHPELGGLWERKAKQAALGDVAFIDAEACRNYAAKARATLAQTLAAEAGS